MKKIYEITVKDVILLHETKSGSHLKSRWIPLYFVKGKLEDLASEIFQRLGDKTVNELEKSIRRVLSYRNLQRLEALWKALDIEMKLRVGINITLALIGKETIQSKTLRQVLDKIKKVTGIDIKEPLDIERFKKHIEFKNDKHTERYPEENPNDKKEDTDFTKIIYSYFNYMNESYNEDLRYLAFLTMKKTADEIALKRSMDNG